VHEARNLAARDFSLFGTPSSDPYVMIKLQDDEIYRTPVMKKTLHPSWTGAVIEVIVQDVRSEALRFIWCVPV
jgi:Ca2+-dependent lipid-binding protein